MIKWIKTLFEIVERYKKDMCLLTLKQQRLEADIESINKILRSVLNTDVDVGFKSSSTIILSGQFKGGDYVEVFQVDTENFEELISILKAMRRQSSIRRIDAPYSLSGFILNRLGE